MSKITVVIPVRNRATIVGRTLDSVKRSGADRVVLVDNGSTDGTLDVLRRSAAENPGWKVVSEPTPGVCKARNRGLAEVTTEYVMFFDSDDLMPERHIAKIESAIRESSPDVIALDSVINTLDGKRLERKFHKKGDPLTNQIFHADLATQRMVVKTEFARNVGGWNEELESWVDLEFGVRVLAERPTLKYVPLAPVEIISQRESITGVRFSDKEGKWERSLDASECLLHEKGLTRFADMIDLRRSILAGHYRSEGNGDGARRLLSAISRRKLLMRAVARYVALGGRGVSRLANII